jgi:hypothetical protein
MHNRTEFKQQCETALGVLLAAVGGVVLLCLLVLGLVGVSALLGG